MAPPTADEVVVFERPVPSPLRVLVWLLFAAMLGAPALTAVGMFDWVESALPFLKELPFGNPSITLLLAMGFLPMTAYGTTVLWSRRRFGRCEIRGNEVSFLIVLSVPRRSSTFFSGELTHYRETRAGLVVEAPGSPDWHKVVAPLLIPTRTPAEVARAVRLLDLPRAGEPPTRTSAAPSP